MYKITQAERVVRIPPARLREEIDDVIEELTCETFEGRYNSGNESSDAEKSVTILIKNVEPVGNGRIVHGDGAVYQTVKYDQVVFCLKENELIEGKVIDIVKFGAFVRLGPLDGLLHISQIMDDQVDVDVENQVIVGKKDPTKTIKRGDIVRARIVSLSINEHNLQDSKIGLTMRQTGLGKREWIEEDSKNAGDA